MTADRTPIPFLPPRIEGLAMIARNLWWSWHNDARALLIKLDEPLWRVTRHNPIMLLRRVDPVRLVECARDPEFLALYDRVMAQFAAAMQSDASWFARHYPDAGQRPVAYFCAEFGLHNSVPIYSGGLGILAGDHCKASSDLGVPLVGLGLFYTKGYFDQRVRLDGWQESSDETFDPASTPLERIWGPAREPWLASVRTYGREIKIGAWRIMVGRVPVYLIDTNLEENHAEDRELASRLYAGGPELRLRQEWLLGVGGVRLLRALGIDPSAWHANEGHAAFMMLERLRERVCAGDSYEDAVREVRRHGIFTTHTPVPAGHDAFPYSMLEECTGPFWEELGIDRERMFDIGRHPVEDDGMFHMTVCAIRLSASVNGVARKHGEVSRGIWAPLWPGRPVEQVPIGSITNGVHLPTWMSYRMMSLLEEHFGDDWDRWLDEPGAWDRVLDIPDAAVWRAHLESKGMLFSFVREEARRRWARHWKEAAHLVGAGTLLNPEALTLGFARRFATYKRANLIFRDIDRLRAILTNQWRPVQIIFAGKAHPSDTPGKQVLQEVYNFTRDTRLEGRIAFLEDYEMHIAHRLVQGVDVWCNLPRVPLEASGTSGMKAALNGVPQVSTLDGWWPEGFDGQNGWAIPPVMTNGDPDAADADRFYRILEEQIVPVYYTRDAEGIPHAWVQKMKHAIRVAGEKFTARRMVRDYVDRYYVPSMHGEPPVDDPPVG